jgi:assimilatory nitrate reductase catalytic subunit
LLPLALTDRISGQPGFKATPARVEPQATDWHGFLIVHGEPARSPDCLWSTRVTIPGGVLYELAGTGSPAAVTRALPRGERIEAADPSRGAMRIAVLQDGKVAALLFIARSGTLPSRDWLISQIGKPQGPAVLAGRAPGAVEDRGPIVCVCFDVGMRTIINAIAEQGLVDVGEVGKALRAGTNCGSCRPAIARLLDEARKPLHAA